MAPNRQKYSRAANHWERLHWRIFGFLSLLLLLAVGLFALIKLPLLSAPKKQYLVEKTGKIEKVSAPDKTTKESIADAVNLERKNKDTDIVAGDEFAKWAVLDYYPGGYHVVYPDGFKTSYTPDTFQANSPGGGSVTVKITGGSFIVTTNTSGLTDEQKRITEAADRLISSSFRFLSGAGYDFQAAKDRFGKK